MSGKELEKLSFIWKPPFFSPKKDMILFMLPGLHNGFTFPSVLIFLPQMFLFSASRLLYFYSTYDALTYILFGFKTE